MAKKKRKADPEKFGWDIEDVQLSKEKHLPGRHDQQRHDPHKGVSRRDVDVQDAFRVDADEEMFDWYIEDVVAESDYMGPGYTGFGVEKPVGPAGSIALVEGKSGTMDLMFETHIDMDERSHWKEKVVKDLAERSGLSEERANELVRTWAETSNDENPTSLGLQKAAAEEFGVELSDWQKERMSDYSWMGREGAGGTFQDAAADGRKLLRASYEATQEQLRGVAPDGKVTLYRGVAGEHISPITRRGDIIPIKSNSVESWSLSYDIAENFADAHRTGRNNSVILKAEVPVERILATPKTGPGCLSEFEFLVLGSEPGGADYVGVADVKISAYYAGVDTQAEALDLEAYVDEEEW